MITSFGYKRGDPPSADKVFDVRDLPHNPADEKFRDRVSQIREYALAHPDESIAIGCLQGQDRSPRLAKEVATSLRRSIRHRDQR